MFAGATRLTVKRELSFCPPRSGGDVPLSLSLSLLDFPLIRNDLVRNYRQPGTTHILVVWSLGEATS